MLMVFFFDIRYNAASEFQAYPPEVRGGSIMIIRGETKTAAEFADFIAKRKKMTPEQIKKVGPNPVNKLCDIARKLPWLNNAQPTSLLFRTF